MSVIIKGKVTKEVYKNGNYRILGFSPIPSDTNKVKINMYGNISLVGELGYLNVNENYEIKIEEKSTDKYGTSYTVLSVPSLAEIDLKSLSREESKAILMTFTTENQANNILDAYPDFIDKVVNEGEESIDVKKIYNVGKVYLKAYIRELNERYKYVHLIKKYSDYEVNITDCKALYEKYITEEKIEEGFNEPYYVLIEVLGRSFERTDTLLCKIRPDLIESNQRCEAMIMDVLHNNENEGSSRLKGSELWQFCQEYDNRLLPLVKDVCENSEHIYYNNETKDVAIMQTYLGEVRVANFIKDKINNSKKLDFDWEKYRVTDDGFELNDAQLNVLKVFCESGLSIVKGYSGCVDADTEYFNGTEWKNISEYTEGEEVLQWNEDGTANLVKPLNYINEPCDMMYHFETRYGLDQTLSGDHRVVYLNKGHNKRKIEEILMEDLYNKYYDEETNYNKFYHSFITTFNYNGKGISLTDEEIELMCAIICDGSFYSKSRPDLKSWKTCRLHIKKDRKKNELRDLFKRGNFEYREVESACEGYTDFYVEAPLREKVFTSEWYNCNNHQLNIICNNILKWDGNINYTKNNIARKRFSTNVKENADFIQFAFSACGYKATIYINDRRGREKVNKTNGKTYIDKTIEYNVSITNRTELKFNNHQENSTKIEKVIPKNNRKYCFTVPSSYLVLRRNNKIFVTGNCGKTFSIKQLIKMLDDCHMTYTLLAPTGKSARVISEQTNRQAYTIHKKCFEGEITTDVIIVDESGMVGLEVMNMLITACTNEDSRFVFVGDPAQIPSISLGKIYEDMIKSEIVPSSNLTEVFRYKSNGSLFVATNVRQGKSFFKDEEMVKTNGNVYAVCDNYKFIETDEDDIAEVVINEYYKLLNKNIKPKDILILAPQNVGEIGTYTINNIIQSEVNPPRANEVIMSRKIGGTNVKFRTGDLVINTKNDYKAVSYEAYMKLKEDCILTEQDVCDKIVVNGQIGIIREVIDKEGLLIQFDEDLIFMNKGKLNQLLLGYSISTFKAQGSTTEYTINIISSKHKRLLSRGLLYVADTRNKKQCVDIGSIDAYETALNININDTRNTFLLELLTQNVEKDLTN